VLLGVDWADWEPVPFRVATAAVCAGNLFMLQRLWQYPVETQHPPSGALRSHCACMLRWCALLHTRAASCMRQALKRGPEGGSCGSGPGTCMLLAQLARLERNGLVNMHAVNVF
jgi:hypothetical protein